jgi:hypothetical protein
MASGSRRVYYQTMMKYGGPGELRAMTGYQVVTGLSSEELGENVIVAIQDGWTLSPGAHIVIEPNPG